MHPQPPSSLPIESMPTSDVFGFDWLLEHDELCAAAIVVLLSSPGSSDEDVCRVLLPAYPQVTLATVGYARWRILAGGLSA